MILSLNEVEVKVLQAARAARTPIGLAEDIASAARWLAMHAFDAIEPALVAIDDEPGAAMAIVDATLAGEPPVEGAPLASPLILLGAAGCAAAAHGRWFRVVYSSGDEAVIGPDCATWAERPAPPAPSRAVLTPLKLSTDDVISVEVPDEAWRRLQSRAAGVYVPSTEASRRGAGADDNDD